MNAQMGVSSQSGSRRIAEREEGSERIGKDGPRLVDLMQFNRPPTAKRHGVRLLRLTRHFRHIEHHQRAVPRRLLAA